MDLKSYIYLERTSQKRKEKTLRALVAQVEGLAAQQPVLMVYEDMHWGDPTTRDALDLLIDRVVPTGNPKWLTAPCESVDNRSDG
jgi:predicted ATPase